MSRLLKRLNRLMPLPSANEPCEDSIAVESAPSGPSIREQIDRLFPAEPSRAPNSPQSAPRISGVSEPDDPLERLRRLLDRRNSRKPDDGPIRIDHLYRPGPVQEKAPQTVGHSRDAQLERLGAEQVETPYGLATVIRRSYPAGSSHGWGRMDLATNPGKWAEWLQEPGLADFDLQRAVFFDLETTGLSHGAGTLAFLAGIGRFVGDSFEVWQYFLDEVGGEQAMLHAMSHHFEECPYLVTYNGKSFDSHILHNRQLLQRMIPTPPLTSRTEKHLDLLHLSRRVFRKVYRDTRLQTLEREELGVVRMEDVPSALIPITYFEFLRTRDIQPVCRVVEHNRIDVLSMVSLLARLRGLLSEPELCVSPKIRLNLARMAMGRGQADDAFALLHATLELARVEMPQFYQIGMKACRALGDRQRMYDWICRWREACPGDPQVHERLSMIHEHRLKDFSTALGYAERARELTRDLGRPIPDTLARRIIRLTRRSLVSSAPARATG